MNDTRLIVPPLDETPWPTLGPEVCDFIEDQLCYGPGDVLGQPVTLTDEIRLYLYRCYEVYPRDHPLAGRRRFKRCFLSRRKGVGKTEVGGWVAICELDPEAPVRCDGWRKEAGVWIPVGRGVVDPYIPMVAYTEEQADDLAYGAVKAILENCELGNDYDIGEERIMHATAPGELRAMATAPSARDGARTTHQHVDEPHLWTEPRHHRTHKVMLNNIPKRRDADAWTHETSTMYGPGEDSIAERAHQRALDALARDDRQIRSYFDHRQASEQWDITKPRQLLAAIKEASGDAWAFADPDAIAALLEDVETDGPNFRRFWLNQRASVATRMFNVVRFEQLAAKRVVLPDTEIVGFFDGSYSRDSTALMGATVEERPHLFVVDAWERPYNDPKWRTPRLEVDAAIDEMMATWRVLELACDPFGWHHEMEEWAQTYGPEVVVRFETIRQTLMGPATDAFTQALKDGGFTHDGDPRLVRHIANCVAAKRGRFLLPTKEADDSPRKIDLAIAAIGGYARASWHHVNGGFAEPWVIRG